MEITAETLEEFKEGQLVLIDKPLEWTSFDVVNKMRYLLKKKFEVKKIKVGHGGTLDPLATGLMMIGIGKATKQLEELQGQDKTYIAKIKLGETTPSFDSETEVDQTFSTEHITKEIVEDALNSFIGEQDQVPPLFSAKHVNGQRAYHLARKGSDMELPPSKVTIYKAELLEYNFPELSVEVVCSKGTYIRSFARDLGRKVNSGGYLSGLRRTQSGSFSIEDAMSIEEFEKKLIDL